MIELLQWSGDLGGRFRAMTASIDEAVHGLAGAARRPAEQARAAEQTRAALAALPKGTRRGLVRTEVRCPGNALLLRVVRIPEHLPGAAYDHHLVVPTSSVTHRRRSGERITARAWFLRYYDSTLTLRCRCHPGVTLTAEQLRGESPPPDGVHVLQS